MKETSPALKIWIAAIIIIAGILVIAFESYRIIIKNTADAFNRQQMFLVRESARGIEALANNMETTLRTAADLLSYYPKEKILKSLFANQEGLIQVFALVNSNGEMLYSYPHDFYALSEAEQFFKNTVKDTSFEGANKSLASLIPLDNGNKMNLSLVMCVPVKIKSQWLFCILNSNEIKNKFIYPICSGKTGYAWVIDNRGFLFAHPNKDFEGKRAIDALKELWPQYSSFNLEEIIKKEMTMGEEGKGEYTSWHLGEKKLTKKLVAYCPIDFKGVLLAIGVSTPYREVISPLHESVIVLGFFLLCFIVIITVGASFLVVQSKRKRLVNQELTWSNEVFDSIADGISIIDRDYKVLMVNKAVCDWHGKPQQFFKEKPCYEVFQQQNQACEGCPSKETFDTGKPAFRERVSTVLSGKKYYFHLNTFPLKDKDNNTVRVAECVKDVTKEMNLRAELIQHERKSMIVKMSAQVAHEIRNPLGTLTLNIDLLEDEINSYSGVDIAEAKDLVSTIKSELDGLNNVLKEYLECARFPTIKPEMHNINTILKNLLFFLEEELRRKKIVIKINYEYNLPMANVDQDQIRGAFHNIIRNAVEAMDYGGTIEVETHWVDNYIEITFTDTGMGIPDGQTEKIFAPFFTTKSGGTGLGLSITQHIINEHKGEIICESMGYGQGTCFKIRIPAYKKMIDD